MEDFGMVQGITSIFGFLAVCVVMMWKIVSDKSKTTHPLLKKITEILDGISKKMSKFAPKTKSNNHNKTKENE